MAETIVSAITEVTLSKVISTVEEQINLQWGFKDELDKLGDSLTMTHGFLQDAETKQFHDRSVQAWLKQLRKFADKAADVLDELAYEDLQRKVETQIRKKVCNFFSISKNPIVFRFKMPQTVKGLNISLDEINARAHGFGLQQRVQALPPLLRGSQDTDSFVDTSQVVGREADVSKIIDLLIDPSTQQTLSIISIVGIGGLGKTTLAKSVCKDKRTKNYFNKIMWVCVCEKFDVEKILEEMFVSVTGQTREGKSRNAILEKIQKELEGKTYLLALDDVWDEDLKTWDDLRGSLLGINENKRCSILVTTRNENVAVVRETPLENRYSARILVEEECWAIIKNRAFQDSSISQQLEDIGREIARKCKGVPLVAAVIGGTMCNKRDIDEWVSLRDSSGWGSLGNSEWIMNVLKLSFDRLPSLSLKQCFVYCSIFPKDFRMEKEQLVQLWMAEGFLQQTRGKEFEDIGDEYFNYLLSISLFQDVERDWLGCITSCKMHDFVHDLALSIRNSEISGTCQIQQQTAYDGARLWHSFFSKSSHFDNVADFKGLRVLSFCDAYISSLPKSIGRLKRLRYFDISNTRIDKLPKSITQLYLLQTLRLLSCNSLEKLPEGMKKLVSLKHLYISYTKHVPSEIGGLTDLQTLPIFDVDTKRVRGIGELRCLNELGGKLEISNLQDVRNKEEAQRAKIWEKKKLHSLKFKWIYRREGEVSKDDEQVLEGLEPHSNLKSLTIESYNAEKCPSWLVFRKRSVSGQTASFQPINLVVLTIRDCPNLSSVPVMSRFSSLETLTIKSCGELTWIGDADVDGVFPSSLKVLEIVECRKLRSIPSVEAEAEGAISSLEKLFVYGCDELREIEEGLLASSTCLRDVRIQDCPNLISIPSIQGCSSLLTLWLDGCKGLTSLPSGLRTSTSLQDLSITNCNSLKSIPEDILSLGCLTSLKTLELGPFSEELEEFPGLTSIHHLHYSSLQSLYLKGWEKLVSLPHPLQHLTSLETLEIRDFGGVKALPEWLGNLSSLRSLEIEHCENLEHLPSAEAMQRLSNLKLLYIHGCWRLKGNSEERSKVSHIPQICGI